MSKIDSVRQKDVDPDAVKKINEAACDWEGVCRICGKHLTGTPAQLREHKHGE